MAQPSSLYRSVLLFAVLSAPAALGCAREEQMMAASGRTPAAEGIVTTEQDDNNNTVVHVRVKHLAPPQRLAADASVYVVWIQPGDAPVQNAGALMVDEDLEGELDFVTAHRVFRLTVTPERAPTIPSPMNRPVFSATVGGG